MRRLTLLFLPCVLTTGCAVAPPDAGFDEVAATVRDRTGHELTLRDASEPPTDSISRLLVEPLTTFTAVQLALLNNPELQADYAALRLSAAQWVEASRLGNPALSVSVKNPREEGANSIEAELLAPLIDLVLRAPRRIFAAAEMRQVQAETVEAIIDLAGDVEGAWYEYLAARRKHDVAQLMLEAAEVGRLLADRFFDAGNTTPLHTALHHDAVGMAQAELATSGLELEAARLELATLMGLSRDQAWAVADELPGVPTSWGERALLEQRMLDEHPSLAVARLDIDKLALALSLERRFRWLGDLDVGVAYERETDRSELYGVALELSLPVFSQGQTEIAAAEARLRRAGWSYRATRGRLLRDLHLALGALEVASRRAAIYRDTIIPAREQAVDFVLREYNYMITGVFDLIEAREREFEAYEAYIEAVADSWKAAADLRRAAGGRLQIEASGSLAIPVLRAESPMDHSQHGMQGGDHSRSGDADPAQTDHPEHRHHDQMVAPALSDESDSLPRHPNAPKNDCHDCGEEHDHTP